MKLVFFNHAKIPQDRVDKLRRIAELLSVKLFEKQDIKIKIRIVKNIVGAPGFIVCGVAKQDLKNNTYTVCIVGELPEIDQVDTLAHELAHVKQYSEDRLWYSGDMIQWVNSRRQIKLYPTVGSYKRYHSRPWEVEARMISARCIKFLQKKGWV